MQVSPAITNFTSGEVSPHLESRSDIKQYQCGALAMENFVVMVQGPTRRRPGTRYLTPVKDSTHRTGLTEFVIAVGKSFMLEWGDKYVRFFHDNHTPVATAGELFNAAIGGTTTDGALTWTNRGFPSASGRTGALNQVIIDPHGNLQICTVAGVPLSPVWNTTVGGFTLDGTAIWQNLGVPQWQAAHTYAANAAIYSAQGVQQVTAGGGGASGAGNANIPYEIPTPYAYSDVFDANGFLQLVWVQSADVAYLVHRSSTFPIYKLSHFADSNWTFELVMMVGGPFADQNPDANPVIFASAQTGTGITLYSSADIFDALIMGAYFQLTEQNIRDIRSWQSGKGNVGKGDLFRYNGVTYQAVDGAGAAPWTMGSSPPIHLSGEAYDGGGGVGVVWRFQDPGYGTVQLKTRAANPSGSAVVITGITVANPPVVTTSSPTPAANGDLIFITGVVGMTDVNDRFYRVAGKAGNTFQLQHDVTGGAIANVDGTTWKPYVSGGTADNRVWTATADVLTQGQNGAPNQLPAAVVGSNNATSLWAIGAWNDRDGYPTAVSFFRGRLSFGRKGKVWTSVADDFENFSALTPNALVTADMAVTLTLPTQDPIQFLVEGRVQVAGTSSAEHSIQEVNPGQAFGPSNRASKKQLKHGSRGVAPVIAGSSLLWAQTSGIKLRSMKYDFGSDNYASQDLNALHDTITKSGIVGIAYQQEPDSIVWLICADGRLIGLTYNEEQGVTAWHRHPMVADAAVEAIACLPAADGSQDELWMIVKRTINGATKRYIEYMAPHFLDGDSLVTDALYADAGFTYSGAPTTTVSGLSHLEGRTVKILTDGAAHPDRVVTGGAIALDIPASIVQVGLPQVAKLTTLPLEAGNPAGSAAGKIKRVISMNIRLRNTLGGSLGRDGDQLDEMTFRTPEDLTDTPVPVYNGMWPPDTYDFKWPAGHEQDGRLTYENDSIYPVTIIGIYPDVDVAP